MGDLSKHFSYAELACKDDCGYGAVHPHLLVVLEAIRRENDGKPLRIVSGLRCPPRNEAVRGATRSSHQWGGAADIPAGIVRPRVAIACGATGVGIRNGWAVHVDVRRTRETVTWNY